MARSSHSWKIEFYRQRHIDELRKLLEFSSIQKISCSQSGEMKRSIPHIRSVNHGLTNNLAGSCLNFILRKSLGDNFSVLFFLLDSSKFRGSYHKTKKPKIKILIFLNNIDTRRKHLQLFDCFFAFCDYFLLLKYCFLVFSVCT